MDQKPSTMPVAMTGNVQGFELPRGCLMTSGVILLPILTMVIGLSRAQGLFDAVVAVLIPVAVIAVFAIIQVFKRQRPAVRV